MKWRHHTMLFWSVGIMVSRDCVLRDWEPYEVIKTWEPYVGVYFGKHYWRIWCEVSPYGWLGKRWGKYRDEAKEAA